MHKPFLASGFLYHSPTQQILLQQFKNGKDVTLALFQGSCTNGESPETVFQHCVEKALKTPIPASSIRPVYDYVHEKLGEHYIFYVELTSATPETYPSKNNSEWVPFMKIPKLTMSQQMRHDLIVAERVIRSLYEAAHPQDNPRKHH